MLIIELTEGFETLDDITRICHRLTEHKALAERLSARQLTDIADILKPTLRADHNERQKRADWQDLIASFDVMDDQGNHYRFYRDEQSQKLYFGTQEGFDLIENLEDKTLNPSSFHRL